MPPLRVVALQHENVATLGWLGEVLAERGVAAQVRNIRDGEALPDVADVDVLISLGGDIAAYDEAQFPWMVDEKRLLAEAVAAGKPVFGICLGGQLLADALGGRTRRAHASEIGYLTLQLTEAGRADPVLRHLDAPTLLWHGDTFELPPGAELLAISDDFPQAYRIGSALGVQFHPETSPTMLRTWVGSIGGEDRERYAPLLPLAERVGPAMRDCSRRMFSAWADEAGL